jgi:hypothetical protein
MGWQNDPIVGQAPTQQQPAQSSGPPAFIPGTPKPITPAQQQDMTIQASREARDAQKDALAIQEKQLDLAGGIEAKAIEGERKAAAFLIRALGANESYEGTGVGSPSYVGQKARDYAPDASNYFTPANRQVANTNQDEFIAASLRQDSGAAIPPEELERQRRIYFPMPGDGPEAIAAKRAARLRAIEGLRQSAGRLEGGAEERYTRLMETADGGPPRDDNAPGVNAGPNGSPPSDGGGGNFRQSFGDYDIRLPSWDKDPSQFTPGEWQAVLNEYGPAWTDENGNPLVDESGRALPPEGGLAFDPSTGQPLGMVGSVNGIKAPDAWYAQQSKVKGEAASSDKVFGEAGAMDLMKQGFTLGLLDESSGVGAAMGGALRGDFNIAENYQTGRDAERLRLEQARQRSGAMGTAAELIGGVATGGAGAINTARQAATAGATAGAVGGFGYGEGTQGSLAGGAFGAGGGAVLGAGGFKLGEKIAARAARTAATRDAGADIARAGEAEGVTVNRAMVDPTVENRITGVETSMAGGPKLRRGMEDVTQQVESRVEGLAPGETTAAQLGDDMQDALGAFRKGEREKAGALYSRADTLSGSKPIVPQGGIRAIDQQIAELEASGSNVNKKAIKFFQDVREDLSKGMTVSGLRDQRTNLRGQIDQRKLTMTDTERRMGIVLDAVSDDVAKGLSGNPQALKIYREADNIWREQARFTRQIEQRLVGPKDNPHSAERTARELDSLMRGDRGRFVRLWRALPKEEKNSIAVYIAQNLGRNNTGEFSPALFLSSTGGKTRTVSDDTLRVVFGDEGFQSIQNLRTLSEQIKRVTSQYNSSNTGRSNDYRSWLLNALFSGGVGLYSGNTGAAMVSVAAIEGARATRDLLSARALLSPKITKWISTAPATSSSKAIDAHFERLAEIARAEPALASEIEALRSGIMQAANDNVGLSAAAGNTEENQQKK